MNPDSLRNRCDLPEEVSSVVVCATFRSPQQSMHHVALMAAVLKESTWRLLELFPCGVNVPAQQLRVLRRLSRLPCAIGDQRRQCSSVMLHAHTPHTHTPSHTLSHPHTLPLLRSTMMTTTGSSGRRSGKSGSRSSSYSSRRQQWAANVSYGESLTGGGGGSVGIVGVGKSAAHSIDCAQLKGLASAVRAPSRETPPSRFAHSHNTCILLVPCFCCSPPFAVLPGVYPLPVGHCLFVCAVCFVVPNRSQAAAHVQLPAAEKVGPAAAAAVHTAATTAASLPPATAATAPAATAASAAAVLGAGAAGSCSCSRRRRWVCLVGSREATLVDVCCARLACAACYFTVKWCMPHHAVLCYAM